MALNINDPEAARLAHELAAVTGESLTEAVVNALAERLLRVRGRASAAPLAEELRLIGERCSKLPVLDDQSPDEILGYDTAGLPH